MKARPPEHRFVNPGVFGPPLCACGFIGGNGITHPLLADHLREHGAERNHLRGGTA